MLTVTMCYGSPNGLTDAQIQSAIKLGSRVRLPREGFIQYVPQGPCSIPSFGNVGNTVEIKYDPVVRARTAATGTQCLFVLSDWSRIALAASSAAVDARKAHQNFSFSVQDARASAIRLGVVTVVLRSAGIFCPDDAEG
jgi:hypothetical protein